MVLALLVVLVSACVGGDEVAIEDPAEAVAEVDAAVPAGVLGLFDGPVQGEFDVARLLAAAQMLDPDADCPPTTAPSSLDGVVEVLRIDGGCAFVEFVALEGRSVSEARAEVLASDSTAYAVGVPPRDLQPDGSALQAPPSPFDGDGFGAADWRHLEQLGAQRLWAADGWEYTDGNGLRHQVPGWPDSAEVIVAVIDTGVDEHRDLVGSLFDPPSDSWLAESCHRADGGGHGTHVAGLVAASRGNGVDVAGIAPRAKIMPVHLLDPAPCAADADDLDADAGEQAGKLTATQAVRLAAEAGADIINMSLWWGTPEDVWETSSGGNDAFQAMVLLMRATHGTFFVSSAGNCGDAADFVNQSTKGGCPNGHNTIAHPKTYSGVIAVAAVDEHNTRASFSSAHEFVDVAAPGDGPTPDSGIRSLVPGSTAYFSGTSMAAPLFSGVLAHMIARYPDATRDQLGEAIIETAHNPDTDAGNDPDGDGWTQNYGWGIVDPVAAIERLDKLVSSTRRSEPPSTIPNVGTEPDPTDPEPDTTAETFTAMSAGGAHSCGLRTDGTVTCWGRNRYGQTDAPSGSFAAVSAGERHSCGVRTDGTITCWGDNTDGYEEEVGQADAPSGSFTAVSAGGFHSCGLRTNGTVTCWGSNRYGQTDAPSGSFAAVSPRGGACGLRTDGTVACWGSVDAPSGSFAAVSGGLHPNACALRSDGTVTCSGRDGDGPADSPSGEFSAVSTAYANDGEGDAYACGVRTDGAITCWGNLTYWYPDPPSGSFTEVSAGEDHSCALRTNGTITCWGMQDLGQLDVPPG